MKGIKKKNKKLEKNKNKKRLIKEIKFYGKIRLYLKKKFKNLEKIYKKLNKDYNKYNILKKLK